METAVRAAYRPRDAAGSPLYRSVLYHLETYLAARTRDKKDASNSAAENSLRSFLQCGIPRFGVARFRCKDCGDTEPSDERGAGGGAGGEGDPGSAAGDRCGGSAWAACMRKVFEVDPVKCGKCTGAMAHTSVILDDREPDRILAHQGWPTEFPKTRRYQDFLGRVCAGPEGSRPKAPRAPPGRAESGGESSQVDPREERWEGKQEVPDEEPA